jgi:hypothetical protein
LQEEWLFFQVLLSKVYKDLPNISSKETQLFPDTKQAGFKAIPFKTHTEKALRL